MQLEWTNGPVTLTEASDLSRAAFRGEMELKRTADRQPLKPRDDTATRSGSKSSRSGNRKGHITSCLELCM